MPEFLSVIGRLLSQPLTIGALALPFSARQGFLEFVLPVGALLVLLKLFGKMCERIVGKLTIPERRAALVKLWCKRAARFVATAGGTVLGLRLFGAEVVGAVEHFFRFLNTPLFAAGNTNISLVTILLAIPVVYASSAVSKFVKRLVDVGILRRVAIPEAQRFSISNVIRYTTLVIVLLVGLTMIGIDVSSITVLLGVFGIGLGFGLQNVVANVFAGIVIILMRPIKEDDWVKVGEYEGTVTTIRLFSSVITTLRNEAVIIPNSLLINDTIYNYSFDSPQVAISSTVQVHYRTDLEILEPLLTAAAARNPHRVADKPARVLISSFDDSGISVMTVLWINNVKDKFVAASLLNMEIWRTFRDNAIEIPYPQMDVHVKSLPAGHTTV